MSVEETPPDEDAAETTLETWEAGLGELIPSAEGHHPLLRMIALLASLGFFALGVVGWLVPVVTGIPFYILGLVTLGIASPGVARHINAWEQRRSPRVRYSLHLMQHRLRRFLRRPSSPPTRPPGPSRTSGPGGSPGAA